MDTTPRWEESMLKAKDGLLVFAGKSAGDLFGAVNNDRQARLEKIAGT